MANKIDAIWSLSLDCDCPSCEEYIDLLDGEDFWDGKRFEPCEHGTDRTQNVEVICPKCGHEFYVDFGW